MENAKISRKHDNKQDTKTDSIANNTHYSNSKHRKGQTKNDKQSYNNTVIHVKLKPELVECTYDVLRIMRNVRYNGIPLAARDDMTIAGLLKKGLKMLINIYMLQILANDAVVKQFDVLNNETLKDFIEFRAQYMNMPINEQVNNLKEIIKSRTIS
ncbi:MAG: hypothetical protein ACE5SW_07595 [Nitrososphaeraceae archaeon]